MTITSRLAAVGLLLTALAGGVTACPGDGLAGQAINLGRAEARDAAWLRGEIEPLLPCRDKNSQLGCMCRPVIQVDMILPPQTIDKSKGKTAARVAADSRRKLLALRRALTAIGDVGHVQIRLEYRTSASGRLILLKPAQLREARKLARNIAPQGATQNVQGIVPPRDKRASAVALYVVRVTFV